MAHHTVTRTIDRASAEDVAALGRAGVATAHESAGRTGLLSARIRPRQNGVATAGSAVTVSSHPGDNLMIHAAVEVCEPGDILVVSTTSPSVHGMFGELLAASLQAHGVNAIVIDAGVRDIGALNDMGFSVWSRAVHAQGTVKATPGSVNIPIVCAEQAIHPGDVIIADDDGVMCVPRDDASNVRAACEKRTANEAEKRAQLSAGALGVDMYSLRSLISELGVEYVDDASGGQ